MNSPTLDPGTQVPPDDAVVTEWFAPIYESVYAVFPPFLKIPGEILSVDRLSDLEDTAEVTPRERWRRLSWMEVQNLVDVPDAYSLLRLLHGKSVTRVLWAKLIRSGLEGPPEGEFPDTMIPDFLRSIRDLGHTEVILREEIEGVPERFLIRDLLEGRMSDSPIRCASTICVDDRSIFYGVNCDSYFVFLCGSCGVVEATVARYGFEGFFFEPGMTSLCWNQSRDV